jgi:guanosine-3',5'-bis(diphosphate) 3'-pyrophosphohydrolase
VENLAVAATAYPDQLDELVSRVQSYNPQADTALIRRAYDYSARMHNEQKREVRRALRDSSAERRVDHRATPLDMPSIVTGLLHDVIEDTGASLDEVQGLFGEEVAGSSMA